jgi:phosphate uptake regulator
MLEKIWNLMREQDNLVKEGRRRAVAMLKTTHEMFHSVIQGIHEGPGGGHRRRVADIDKHINHEQREVRRMVFEHLALSSTRDLLEGLRLVTVVIDIERLGDLSKNIEELFEMMPKGLDFGEGEGVFNEIEQLALDVFKHTEAAFEHNDEAAARAAIAGYNEVARRCEKHLRDALTETSGDDCVRRSDLGFMLLLRYIKRTCGHLKNIASAVTNPFDRIGFKDGIG